MFSSDLTAGGVAGDFSYDPQSARCYGARVSADEASLFQRFERRIYLFGLRHLRDRDAAKDLVQDVLSVVLEKLRSGEVREVDKLPSFVLGTCRLLVQNRHRSEARRKKILARYADPRDTTEPEASASDAARLQGCLQSLADRERAVLVLSFYAEQSGDAIARELGVTSANVRVIRHRALGRLRECMGDPT